MANFYDKAAIIADHDDPSLGASVLDLASNNAVAVALVDATGAQITTFPVSGTVAVTQSTSPWVVSATDLDIRNLVFATDKVDVSGSTGVGVTGTFWQATQPISAASLPLPTGASTLAEQQSQTTHLATIAGDTTAIETAVQIMDDWDESDRAKANIIVGQAGITAGAGSVAANTPRVTMASDSPDVTHLATIAGDTTDIETAVELIDDAIVTDDAAFTPATTKVMMAGFEYDDTSPDSVNEGDGGAGRMSANRNQYIQIRDNAGNERGANVDATANLMVNLGTLVEGEDQTYHRMMTMPKYSYVYISTATTTTAKTGAGVFHGIVVQGGTTGTIIIYDNTAGSGTIIASFDTTVALASYFFDVPFSTGLTIVTSAATKITAMYL